MYDPGYDPYGGYGPPNSAQQRLQALEARYGPYGRGNGNTYPPGPGGPYTASERPSAASIIRGRPVANEQEANAAEIDYDGSLFVFLDKAHGRIYTKQLGMDGNILFHRYVMEMAPMAIQEPAVAAYPSEGYVNMGDLDRRLSEALKRLDEVETKVSDLVGGKNKGGSEK